MIGITGLQIVFLNSSRSLLGKTLLELTIILGALVLASFITTRLLKKIFR